MKSVILFLLKTAKDIQSLTHIFLPEKFCVIDISANGNILLTENTTTGFCLNNTPTILNFLTAHYPCNPDRILKETVLIIMKIFTGEMLSNLLPGMDTQIMMSLRNRQSLTRLCLT